MIQRGIEISSLVQVTWQMNDDATREREINGIVEASTATGCRNLYIITAYDSEEIELENGLKIHVLPAWQWLLER